jgi:bifunctional non-homologous end joining protein LigD
MKSSMTATGCAWSAPATRATVLQGRPRLDQPFSVDLETARKIRKTQFVIDGEARGARRGWHLRLQRPAFPKARPRGPTLRLRLPSLWRDDLSRLPLHLRKTNLAQLLRGRPEGIFAAPFEQGEIGPELFEAACRMGLEGLVSKHRERGYRPGRCDHWVKVKNRRHAECRGTEL